MLNNPQDKLNKQVQSNAEGLRKQVNQPKPMASQPGRLELDTKPQLAKPEQQTLQDQKGNKQIVPEEPGQGFGAKLKAKLAQKAKAKLSSMLEKNPEQRQPQTDAPGPQAAQSSPKPQVPKPQIPQSGFKRPSPPKPSIPKMPKLR